MPPLRSMEILNFHKFAHFKERQLHYFKGQTSSNLFANFVYLFKSISCIFCALYFNEVICRILLENVEMQPLSFTLSPLSMCVSLCKVMSWFYSRMHP